MPIPDEYPEFPAALSIAGFDPSGGAGIQADLLTFASMGAHGCAAITAITIQDTSDVKGYINIDANDVIAQARVVLEDIPVQAIKIGMLGSVATVEAIAVLLNDYADIPVILDPLLRSGSGDKLADAGVQEAIAHLLIPRCTLMTPNTLEARQLTPTADTLEACGHELLSMGAQYVLITGGHEPSTQVESWLYHEQQLIEHFKQERAPGVFHGTGCTIAAAAAAAIAHGLDVVSAVKEALEFTHNAVRFAYRPGVGQLVPDRLFWAREEYEPSHEALQ